MLKFDDVMNDQWKRSYLYSKKRYIEKVLKHAHNLFKENGTGECYLFSTNDDK